MLLKFSPGVNFGRSVGNFSPGVNFARSAIYDFPRGEFSRSAIFLKKSRAKRPITRNFGKFLYLNIVPKRPFGW